MCDTGVALLSTDHKRFVEPDGLFTGIEQRTCFAAKPLLNLLEHLPACLAHRSGWFPDCQYAFWGKEKSRRVCMHSEGCREARQGEGCGDVMVQGNGSRPQYSVRRVKVYVAPELSCSLESDPTRRLFTVVGGWPHLGHCSDNSHVVKYNLPISGLLLRSQAYLRHPSNISGPRVAAVTHWLTASGQLTNCRQLTVTKPLVDLLPLLRFALDIGSGDKMAAFELDSPLREEIEWSRRAGIEPGSPCWEASGLTSQPPWPRIENESRKL
ncbi:hypothetical protein PR048_012388 [Dryococelus australis]|uniref:Uncharacterized protein n=1 Tax=Dryococelus australis TaxID=614101 RepID=A0ABQ9HPV1_9NEOP|nr:hypothetical protein PR048_012388 [Dryococelus australis]